jgi:hypothetical protein
MLRETAPVPTHCSAAKTKIIAFLHSSPDQTLCISLFLLLSLYILFFLIYSIFFVLHLFLNYYTNILRIR